MCAARDMKREALLNSNDDDNDIDEIKQFYMTNLPQLMLPLSYVDSHILKNIAIMIHNTLLFDSDWAEYATKMGVTDNFMLAKIHVSAKSCHEPELFITLRAALPHKMFGHIITTLMSLPRYDILTIIKSDVIKLLERTSTTEVKQVSVTSCVHQQLPEVQAEQLTNITNFSEDFNSVTSTVQKHLDYNESKKLNTFELNPKLLDERNKEFISLQQCSTNNDFTNVFQNHDISQSSETLIEGSSEQDLNIFPSTPTENRLSVLIQHSDLDSPIAVQLSEMLQKEGIAVKTLSDMDNIIAMNPTGALNTIFQEVNFIVPVVSENLLKQIRPVVYDKYLESMDDMNNRMLYELIMNEFRNNRCVNFRVRPVIIPNMDRRKLTSDVILSFSFRLWGEVPKLIKVLKETKELIPHYSLVNSMKNS